MYIVIRIIVYVLISTVLIVGVKAYNYAHADKPEPRNEWGQRPLIDQKLRCTGTILQWTKACGDTWIDRQQREDDERAKG